MSLLDPVSHALAGVLAGAHSALTSLGLDPASGAVWALSVAALVVTVRVALLPITVHGVRVSHATARARPQLQALAEKYKGKRDTDSLRAMTEERRQIAAEHQLSTLGCLPLLLQMPVWFALYRLVSDVAGGSPVGAIGTSLVDSLRAATLLGVPLAGKGYTGGLDHVAVVGALAGTAALLSYVTQKFASLPNTNVDAMPEAFAQVQHMLPAISAAGVLLTGGVVPVALLVYWVFNSSWSLAQSAVITRWFPTPGTPASRSREERLTRSGAATPGR